jgi:hypothetical protein
MKKWDSREQEYAFDHGWRFDKDEMLILTKQQFRAAPYTGRSVRDSKVRTIMLPTVNGSCLILEGLHFRVEG